MRKIWVALLACVASSIVAACDVGDFFALPVPDRGDDSGIVRLCVNGRVLENGLSRRFYSVMLQASVAGVVAPSRMAYMQAGRVLEGVALPVLDGEARVQECVVALSLLQGSSGLLMRYGLECAGEGRSAGVVSVPGAASFRVPVGSGRIQIGMSVFVDDRDDDQ